MGVRQWRSTLWEGHRVQDHLTAIVLSAPPVQRSVHVVLRCDMCRDRQQSQRAEDLKRDHSEVAAALSGKLLHTPQDDLKGQRFLQTAGMRCMATAFLKAQDVKQNRVA